MFPVIFELTERERSDLQSLLLTSPFMKTAREPHRTNLRAKLQDEHLIKPEAISAEDHNSTSDLKELYEIPLTEDEATLFALLISQGPFGQVRQALIEAYPDIETAI